MINSTVLMNATCNSTLLISAMCDDWRASEITYKIVIPFSIVQTLLHVPLNILSRWIYSKYFKRQTPDEGTHALLRQQAKKIDEMEKQLAEFATQLKNLANGAPKDEIDPPNAEEKKNPATAGRHVYQKR
uniref:Uncharacterized protein n=1 Tax=Acrobeloides nanus TaxID=290746 RepID=A0A914EMP8_9BILA